MFLEFDDDAELPLPFRNLSGDELNTFTLGKDFHNIYYEDQSAKSFKNIVINVKATPFIPFPELLLRRAMISGFGYTMFLLKTYLETALSTWKHFQLILSLHQTCWKLSNLSKMMETLFSISSL